MSVLAAVQNIDNLDAIKPLIAKIAEIHCDCNVKAEHYPIVGKHLLGAIKKVLGDEVLNAWGEVYQVLAEVFINNEKNIYTSR